MTKIQTDAKRAGCPLGGGTPSAGTATSAAASTATNNPQAKAACAKIIGDIPGLGSLNGITRYGKDIANLMPVVTGAQQTIVIDSVGHIEKFLHAVATGSDPTSAEKSVTSDARKLGQICAGYIKNP